MSTPHVKLVETINSPDCAGCLFYVARTCYCTVARAITMRGGPLDCSNVDFSILVCTDRALRALVERYAGKDVFIVNAQLELRTYKRALKREVR